MPGEPGLWVFLFGDMFLFAVLFAVYLSSRAREPGLLLISQQKLNPDIGFVKTLLLLTSSLFVVQALRAVREDRARTAPTLIAGAFAGGLTFAGLKFFEYRTEISRGLRHRQVLPLLLSAHRFSPIPFDPGPGRPNLPVVACLPAAAERQPAGDGRRWRLLLLWIVLFPLLYLVR